MTSSALEVQKLAEAQRRYDNLTARIDAVDSDIGKETDGDRALALVAKRAELAAQRETASAELTAIEKRSNGDLATLTRKVSELGKVLASDNPAAAHAIIMEATDALARLDARVLGLEGRVLAIEYHINPPVVVTMWRVFALIVVLFGGTLFWVKDSRDVLFGIAPWAGLIIELVLVLLAVACFLLAKAKLQERKS